MQDSPIATDKKTEIEEAIVSGILSGRIKPGTRLGESQLATVFSVSRTRVREALMRLEARCIVQVSPRRGWYVIEPSAEEAMMVYGARRALESGMMRSLSALPPDGPAILEAHLDQERAAIASGDRQRLTYLMGDFHIRIAELSGNTVLVDILRDLTARTMLISLQYQSDFHARQSHEGHCAIAAALIAGDVAKAAALSIEHLDEVEAGLDLTVRPDPLADLRHSLSLPTSRSCSLQSAGTPFPTNQGD
ncbi:GntR family transcriptional regulator [Rhizobium sp. CCGE 510]|uniref:GntR family transcriptional regulator n=1 Tax=Rhizobium sp. CCGE 510 TaxID=1132836 RepID=UPI00027B9165|nr:GntR family transcriptional regulator [Rhizobium sp. CCGE 510]EJT01574.1 Uxu operon regulator [Rhizobium sp. CCGE 510]